MDVSSSFKFLLTPISENNPCGINLEYDNEFVLLLSNLVPKETVQYGDFVSQEEKINWLGIEEKTRNLLSKSIDIRLIIILMRAKLNEDALSTLHDGLDALYQLLQTWPDHIHPQLYDEGEYVPLMRANAFNEMNNYHGFISELKNAKIDKNIDESLTFLQLEDFIENDNENTDKINKFEKILNTWKENNPGKRKTILHSFELFNKINHLLDESLGIDKPEMNRLGSLLYTLVKWVSGGDSVMQSNQMINNHTNDMAALPNGNPELSAQSMQIPCIIQSPDDIKASLSKIIHWLSIHEPSSPVLLLLDYAKQSIGKNFIELVDMYPSEVLTLLKKNLEP